MVSSSVELFYFNEDVFNSVVCKYVVCKVKMQWVLKKLIALLNELLCKFV